MKRRQVRGFLAILAIWMSTPLATEAGEGIVALRTADPSCGDDSSAIYVDCGNGTVTDNRTGLVWLANANCFGEMTWEDAMTVVTGLSDLECSVPDPDSECDCGLEDGSSPGEWRLPSRTELTDMLADAYSMGCFPAITTDAGFGFPDACWDQDCVEAGSCTIFNVQDDWYWTSSIYVANPDRAWAPDLSCQCDGTVPRSLTGFFWPVRGGQ